MTRLRMMIRLGNGREVHLGDYVAGIKGAIANPEKTYSHGLTGWWPVTGAEIRREFFGMVQDHCNRGLSISGKDKNAVIARAYRRGRISVCRNCGNDFTRRNPFNDNDRFCSDECRAEYYR